MNAGNGDGFESPINKPDPRSAGGNKGGSKGGEFQSPVLSGDKGEKDGHKAK